MFTVEDADGDDIVVELTDINPPSDSPFGQPFIISATSPTTCKHLSPYEINESLMGVFFFCLTLVPLV